MMGAGHEIDTAAVVERCRRGDMDALRLLYVSYYAVLLNTARRYVDDDTARDVVHDAILMAYSSLHTLHDDTKVEAWLSRIVRNMALNHIKHEQVIKKQPIESVQDILPDDVPAEPLVPLDVLMNMVRRLPDGYEQVFRLRTLAGLSHDEISRRLGITSSTSRSQYTHARRMLKDMVRRYWALALLLLVSLTYLLFQSDHAPHSTGKPLISTSQESYGDTLTLQSVLAQEPMHAPNPASTNMPAPTSVAIMTDSVAAADPSTPTPLRAMTRLALDLPRWSNTPTAVYAVMPNINAVRPVKAKQGHGRAQLHLAYDGAPAAASTSVNNFLSVINYVAGGTQRNVRLYTWQDYADYLKSNATYMDTVESNFMHQIIEQHTDTIPADIADGTGQEVRYDSTPLSEVKHHERPRTYMLSLTYPLNARWSMVSGLGVTTMRSTFESQDNGNEMSRRTQRLYYLTLPIGATYNIWHHKRLSLYATGSLQLDVPLAGRETTRYLYTGVNAHEPGDSLVFPTTHASVRAPWQWSVGVGAGVQYQLLPHLNAFFEPSFRYYIPTHGPIENYRTEHPWDIALPFGFRFVP